VKTLTITEGREPKLAVFDVEGVLIPRNRLFFDVARSLGFAHLFRVLLMGFLYEIGALPLKQALTRIFWTIRGTKLEVFYQTIDNLPLMPNSKEVFDTLRAEGCKTALISSGIPTFLVDRLAKQVGADYAIGVEVSIEGDFFTGEVWGDVTESNGKFLVLKELLEEGNLTPSDCVVVADDRNNSSIFLKDALKIGYNSDFIIKTKADAIVTGRLSKILPIIHGVQKTKSFPSSKDLLRESIHASGIFMPIFAIYLGVPLVALFISLVIVFYTVSELSRVKGMNVPFFSTVTRHAASQSELCEFTTAPLYFAFGILLTLLLFPAPASYAAIAIFTFGDSTASLIGGTLSKKPMPFNRSKTLEGSLGGFFFAFLGALMFVSPWIALVGAAIGMTIEFLPLPINDNLLIPICTALALMFII
jgi:dolichol kinase/phosphoglycolate phosphatase-like HAD superfamily hydrolase